MILLEKKWQVPQSIASCETKLSLTKSLLFSRGLQSNEEISTFLAEHPNVWHDPFLFRDMKEAATRIAAAVTGAERILIYGDYDADGVTATALLTLFLRKVHANVEYYVPNRLKDGYGMSEGGVDYILEKHPDLVITVDCGVANEEAVMALNDANIDTIITDHHEMKEDIPPALAVICAKRQDNTYPFVHLCGAGVALKLVEACCRCMPNRTLPNDWQEYLDIAALGTIADVVSITGENRTIVKEGLSSIGNAKRLGLQALMTAVSSASPTAGKALTSGTPSATTVAFQIIPKINAAGRMGDASRAVALLTTNQPNEAKRLATELVEENVRRQDMEQMVFNDAVKLIENPVDPKRSLAHTKGPIIVCGDDWHIGIIGIVAARICSKYQKTAIVFTRNTNDKDVMKGSARVCGGYPILEALSYARETILEYGGHKKAAGLSVESKHWDAFLDAMEAFSNERDMGEDDVQIELEREIFADDLNVETCKEIMQLAPFGEGNREPLFLLRNATIVSATKCGNDRHLKLSLALDGCREMKDAIAFGFGDKKDLFAAGSKVDLAVELMLNEWNGRETVSIQVADIHFTSRGQMLYDAIGVPEKLFRNKLGVKQIAMLAKTSEATLKPTGDMVKNTYQFIRNQCANEMNICDIRLLSRMISSNYSMEMNPFQLSRILDIFSEAGLIDLLRMNDERVCFSLLFVDGKVKLENTKTYRILFE